MKQTVASEKMQHPKLIAKSFPPQNTLIIRGKEISAKSGRAIRRYGKGEEGKQKVYLSK